MTSETLGLVQVGKTLDYRLSTVSEPISLAYPFIKPSLVAHVCDPAEAYDSYRKQYHSTRILAMLEDEMKSLGVGRLLGVTSLDLFAPGLNFVFGEARLPGRVGVISTHRLRGPRGGNDLLEERVAKEAVHETGHMIGLEHCTTPSCVMYFSNTLTDTDRKTQYPCSTCKSRVLLKIEQ